MAKTADGIFREHKRMNGLAFTLTWTAVLALGACSGNNQDVVNNAELNQPGADLNELSNQAAMDAANAEAAALGNQQQQLDQLNADNSTNPSDAEEQNVSGM
jgi:hypothetical protein